MFQGQWIELNNLPIMLSLCCWRSFPSLSLSLSLPSVIQFKTNLSHCFLSIVYGDLLVSVANSRFSSFCFHSFLSSSSSLLIACARTTFRLQLLLWCACFVHELQLLWFCWILIWLLDNSPFLPLLLHQTDASFFFKTSCCLSEFGVQNKTFQRTKSQEWEKWTKIEVEAFFWSLVKTKFEFFEAFF